MRVEIYSDIACPWCYIGKRRFDRALAAFPGGKDVEVVFRPYQLVPEAPMEATPHRAWLNERYGPQSRQMDDRVAALGAREGITYDFDKALHVNTLHAHRLLWLAGREYGAAVQGDLKERLLAAHFADGVDVADHAQLTEVAVAAGLDRDRVAAFLSTEEGTQEVREEIADAQRVGVTAVPTFVFEGQWAVQGAQETSVFLGALEQISAKLAEAEAGSEAEAVAAADAGDACADGSCAI